jgi:uncharacterized phage protein (TIGR02218 family)
MRAIPAALQAHLDTGATTLCHLWRVVRRDGASFGFTDHDRDLVVAGQHYAAATGLEGSAQEAVLGLGISGAEVAGALTAASITAADIAAGRWDGALVEVWLVNFTDASQRLLLDSGEIGDIRQQDGRFVAEFRSIAHRLDQEQGRRYTARCPATLGDARCKVAIAAAPWQHDTAVLASDGRGGLVVPALAGLAAGALEGGTVRFLSGASIGLVASIAADQNAGGQRRLTLWQPTLQPIAVGDAVRVQAGCDKRLATCHGRFANAVNFQGFPHLPGNDFVLAGTRADPGSHDGGALVP